MPTTAPPRPRGDHVDSIPLGIIDGVGITGVLGVLFWMLATGRLVVGRVLDDAIRQRDAAETRAAEARDIARKATSALEQLSRRDDLGVALLKSIERQASGGDES